MDDLKSAVDGKPLDDLVKAWGVADHYEITDVYLELTNKIVPCATSATWNSDKVKVGVIGNCDGKVSVRFDNSGSKANNYKYEIAEGVECK